MGWVHRRRDLGGLIFIHLRDRDGITQLVFDESKNAAAHKRAQELSSEFVIAVEGLVDKRSADTVNPTIATGEVEIAVAKIWILNESRTPPFPLEDNVDVKEEVRLKYRYVDLRRPRISATSSCARRLRSLYGRRCMHRVPGNRNAFYDALHARRRARLFGAQPRAAPGSFYALPQSPQIFKQLLMVSGYERYFQIVRCFRDEDLRADRQPEFTQIDLEMSFPQEEQIYEVIEPLVKAWWRRPAKRWMRRFRASPLPMPSSYGSDKPDLRLPPFLLCRGFVRRNGFQEEGLPLVAIHIPKTGSLSRKERDEIKAIGQERGCAYLTI